MTTTSTPDEPAVTDVTSQTQLLAWIALVVPILAWTVHIIALASLVRLACVHPPVAWVMHGLTIGLGLIVIGCMLIALRTVRLPNGEDAGTTKANIRFLSQLAFLVGAINLLLIAAEGVYVPFLHACHGA